MRISRIINFLIFSFILVIYNCSKSRPSGKTSSSDVVANNESTVVDTLTQKTAYKVTFVELGSVRCIPCKMMQPIMEAIEKDYAGQVKVVFHDVWTDEGQPYARKYGIRLIPTQIFLDQDGNEYFRHEGYFPKDELIKVLQKKGVQ